MTHDLLAGVTQFVVLLSAALAISIAAERIRIPAAVLLVGLGAAAGLIWHVAVPFAFGPALLFVFLPPLVFEAAWTLDLRELRSGWARVGLMAFPGTLASAFGIGAVLAAIGALPFASALVLGAIVSATDPVAVVAVFRSVRVPAALRTLVEAESLSNDGVALVLYSIAVSVAMGAAVSWESQTLHGVAAILGGSALGAACAIVFWLALSVTPSSEYEVTATVALAYLSYLAANSFGFSGIFAAAAAAIALRALLERKPLMTNEDEVTAFWNAAAFIANAAVLLATGLVIDPARILEEPVVVIAALGIVLIMRAALCLFAARDGAGRLTIFMAGMRGALPLALALALPAALPGRQQIIDAVYATVLITLVVQGVPLRPLVERLYRD